MPFPTPELSSLLHPYHGTDGAYSKDRIENELHTLVYGGSLSLATAQHAIATNWYTAYQTYLGTPAAPTGTAPAPPATTTAAPQQAIH